MDGRWSRDYANVRGSNVPSVGIVHGWGNIWIFPDTFNREIQKCTQLQKWNTERNSTEPVAVATLGPFLLFRVCVCFFLVF